MCVPASIYGLIGKHQEKFSVRLPALLLLSLPIGVVLLWTILGNLQRHRLGRRDTIRVLVADNEVVGVARLSPHGNIAIRYPGIAQGLLSLGERLALGVRRARSTTPDEHE